jgi:hypothetical protein
MKKIFTILTFLYFILGLDINANAQFVDIGTGTTTNTTTGAAPINIWFRSMHYQVVYTAAELTSSGALPGDTISALGWYVTGVPINNLPNYTIKLKHTNALDASVYDGAGLATVVTVPLHAPTAGGYDMVSFTTNFIWNGAQNVLVDVCFDQVNPTFNASGIVRTFAGSSRFVRSDGSSQCSVATSTNLTYRPQVRLAMDGGTVPTCPVPTGITVNPLPTSAIISFTSTAPLHVVEFGPVGFTQGTGTSQLGISNPMTITGLMPNTDYSFYLYDSCGVGDVSFASGPYTFTTPCSSYTAPWFYNVESALATTNANIEDCWTANPTLTTSLYRWDVTSNGLTPSTGTGASAANSGTKYFYTESSSGATGAIANLETPLVDVSGLTTPAVIFYYHLFGPTTGTLFVDAFDGTNWNPVDTIVGQQQTATTDAWRLRIVALPGYTGLIKARFRSARGTSFTSDMCLDDIRIEEAPTCFPPTNPSFSNLTATSADLNWTTGGSSTWQVEYGPVGFVQGTGTIVPVTGLPFTLNGLTPNTLYDFYVQDSCGVTDVSYWTTGPEFKTLCATYIAPWYYNVETATPVTNALIEDCWATTPTVTTTLFRWNVTGTGITPNSTTTGAGYAYSGNKYFYTESSNGSFNSVAQLESPDVDITGLATPAVMFHYHFFGPTIGKMYIDVFDGTSWVNNIDSIVGQQQTSGAAPWIFHTTSLSGYTGVINVRFRALRGASFTGDMCLDDIRIDDIPTCFAPTALIDSVLDPYTVSLAWTTGGASNWIIEYGPEGFAPGSGTFVSTASNPAIISGLTPGLDYDWYVQDSCSATDVSWQSTDGNFRMPNVVFCDSTNNFTYCHPDESIETYTYQSENGSGQLHVVFNSGTVASLVDFNIYDGPDATYPVLYSSTGGSNMANVEFTSASSIITMVHNSVSANPCTAPLDFDINCCVPTSSFQNIFICVDSSFTLADGTVVSNAGGYSAVIPNVLGCDSNITYILQFLPDTVSATDKLCAGEIYLFADGSSTNVPGQFQVTTSNMLGCDSTINYTIEGISPSSSNYVAEICQGEFYIMPNGATVSTVGPHVAVIPNAVGCDSTITVNLIVRPHTFGAQNVTLCEGQTLELPDGVTASTAGQYTSLVTNYYGCDSTVTTNLSYASTSFGNVVIEICGEETYTLLNGDEVTEAGEYNISIDNAAGCDSIVTVYVSKCSAIDGTTQDLLSIYPNPASSFVTIAFNEVMMNAMDLKIINAIGQTVYTIENVKDKSIKVNVENFANGLYFIVLNNKDQSSLHKFMISK